MNYEKPNSAFKQGHGKQSHQGYKTETFSTVGPIPNELQHEKHFHHRHSFLKWAESQ